LTPEQQFQVAIREARTTAEQIRPDAWLMQILELARRFANELQGIQVAGSRYTQHAVRNTQEAS
jgi:hypothetical protein